MRIGIIALGLIGGSLLKALSQNKELEITAVSQNESTLNKAKKYAKRVSAKLEDLKDSELVFVCTPINNTLETLDKLEDIAGENCIVTDVSSVKTFVMKKKRPYKFIGSHPMAGTEFSGFDSSFKELFKGAKWVITPFEDSKETDINKLEGIITSTGAKTIITKAEEHDKAVALISHMPMLVSQALYKSATRNSLAMKLASSGFRDMTRLAMSNPTMANDMLTFNKEAVDEALESLDESLKLLDSNKYFEMISEIKSSREKMYSKEGKNLIL